MKSAQAPATNKDTLASKATVTERQSAMDAEVERYFLNACEFRNRQIQEFLRQSKIKHERKRLLKLIRKARISQGKTQ